MTTLSQIAWDDTVLPFQLDNSDVRGRVARLDGVLEVRDSKLILLQVDRSALDAVVKLLPASNAPTVMALDGSPDRLALQALCRGGFSWQQLEDIQRAGARGLMVLPVEQMLA